MATDVVKEWQARNRAVREVVVDLEYFIERHVSGLLQCHEALRIMHVGIIMLEGAADVAETCPQVYVRSVR